MIEQAITDWNDAYDNVGNIVNGADYPPLWQSQSEQFRRTASKQLDISYGTHDRERYDLFLPDSKRHETPIGLFIYIHGGYWQRTDKSFWSFVAKGPTDAGWAVAVPSYVLCPEADIAAIEHAVSHAVTHASEQIDGPIVLAGHSAGGQLVQCMMCEDSKLPERVIRRLVHTLSISGIADLRPLLETRLNDALQLDERSACQCSPVLKRPILSVPLTAWVGANERSEFVRQNRLIANIWRGLGASTIAIEEPDKNHFTVVEGLCDMRSSMLRAVLSQL